MGDAHSPLVTVYITNHNYGRYIEQAIQSVLRQTQRDFELIIIDDGSTDNSREVIERYAEHRQVVTIFQQNKGLNVTNNIALRAARGKYVMRLDADDYLDEHAVEVLSGVLEREPDAGLVFPDYYLVDEQGHVLEQVRRHDFDEVTLLDQPAHGACTMMRREALLELGGYDESFTCHDGYDLWLRFIQHGRVRNVNLPLFYYRQHERSLTSDEGRILATRAQIVEKQTRANGQRLSAVAIVPVRGSALDPQSLALRPLAGRRLIDWTLEPALGAQRVSDVIVTTPDEEVLCHVAGSHEGRVMALQRERKLALPNTYIEDTLAHALGEYTKDHAAPDAIVVLYIESPFRTARHIDNAIDTLALFESDSVVSVRTDTGVFHQHAGGGLRPLRENRLLRLEREELYREVGQIYATRRSGGTRGDRSDGGLAAALGMGLADCRRSGAADAAGAAGGAHDIGGTSWTFAVSKKPGSPQRSA